MKKIVFIILLICIIASPADIKVFIDAIVDTTYGVNGYKWWVFYKFGDSTYFVTDWAQPIKQSKISNDTLTIFIPFYVFFENDSCIRQVALYPVPGTGMSLHVRIREKTGVVKNSCLNIDFTYSSYLRGGVWYLKP